MRSTRLRLSIIAGVGMAVMGLGAGLAMAGGMQGERTVPVVALHSASASLNSAQVLIQRVSHGTMRVVKTFPGPQTNITGILVKGPVVQEHPVIAWMVDNHYLMSGPLFDAHGRNLTFQAAMRLGLIPKPMAPQKLAQSALLSPGFTLGKSGPLMVVFMDPNCIFCHTFWDAVQPEVAAGKLRVKVVPVGFLKPSSFPKAVTILMGKNKVQAWSYDEAHFHVHAEEGGTVPEKHLNPAAIAEVRANTALLARTGEVATPTVVVCQKGQKLPAIRHGLPAGGLKQILSGAQSLQADGSCGAVS